MKQSSILTNPKTYTLASMIIGYVLIGDLTPNEQNALGNFFMTIGQILEGNYAITQIINDYTNNNDNDKIIKALAQDKQVINELIKMCDDLKEKLDKLSS